MQNFDNSLHKRFEPIFINKMDHHSETFLLLYLLFRYEIKFYSYRCFLNELHRARYSEPMPIMSADQDIDLLAVAITRQSSIVSELNLADSGRLRSYINKAKDQLGKKNEL